MLCGLTASVATLARGGIGCLFLILSTRIGIPIPSTFAAYSALSSRYSLESVRAVTRRVGQRQRLQRGGVDCSPTAVYAATVLRLGFTSISPDARSPSTRPSLCPRIDGANFF